MNIQIEKTYHLLFYKLVKFTYMMNRRHYRHYELQDGVFGASFAILVLFIFFVFFIMNCIEIFTGFNLWENDIVVIGLVVLICLSYVFLHFTLLSQGQWMKYEIEFEAYSRKRNRKINITITLFAILLLALLILSIAVM